MTTPKHFILTILVALAAATALQGQQQFTPHIGYVFPAGGRQGATFLVKVGGQYLGNATNAYVSGAGIQAVVVDYVRPLTQQQINQFREKLKELQDKRAAARQAGGGDAVTEDRRMIAEIREKIAQSQKKMANPVIAEVVTLKIAISSNAEPGEREIRLGTPNALSDPLVFYVSQLPEFNKPEPPAVSPFPAVFRRRSDVEKAVAPVDSHIALPCVVNGQIMPGGVDRYHFQARKSQRLVISATARELIPYLADAVPGWFQAVLSLYDAQGREVAYADHFRFHPDPVLFYEVPKDGEYVLQVRDSIYRGRDDFVYRITAGELPFVTGIFPLGGPVGVKTIVKLAGWNLPRETLTEDDRKAAPGIYPVSVSAEKYVSDHLPFAVDALPECLSRKSNHSQSTAQLVALPIIINGRISQTGQWDVFRFQGHDGDKIVAEVIARRLDSPLDSVLRLTDETGKQLAFNDDYEDKGAGLQTHYADSYLCLTLPATGPYYLHIGDAQQQGGLEYTYRLRLSAPRPDFALRITPSSLTVRGGMAVPFTVHVLRRDGFTNEIKLALRDAPADFTLSGGPVPANKNEVRLTLCAPVESGGRDFDLSLDGHAMINGREIVRPAVPAEDMMQAFAYRHLVPSKELKVIVANRPQLMTPLKILDTASVKIPAGGTVEVRVQTPVRAYIGNNYKLELNEPPDGISIEKVSQSGAETEIILHSDAAKMKQGLKGNLIVDITINRQGAAQAKGKNRGNQTRIALGTLPAIPFEIVAP